MNLNGRSIILSPEDQTTPKLITGTRLAAILGKNEYSSPFQCWCEMQKVWTPPFEDNKYTLAGKAIEPKQAEYIKTYHCPTLVSPTDKFGDGYFNKTKGNFFNDDHFGGMWDYLDEQNDVVTRVFEMKTAGKSKKSCWTGDKIPESYAMQAALYAWLLKCDDVTMVATFLDQKAGDYEYPNLVCVSDANTIQKSFKLSERFPTFEQDFIAPALNWWDTYIITGISPEFDPHNETDCAIIMELEGKGLILFDRSVLVSGEDDEEANDSSRYGALDNLISEIQEKFGPGSFDNFEDINKYKVELATAIYFMSTKAVLAEDEVGRDKIESARGMLNALNSISLSDVSYIKHSHRLNE